MAVVRWDPLRELATMQERMNRLFGDLYTRRGEDDVMTRGDWVPAVDIFENDQHEIVLKAEVPGLAREDIDLRIENNMLTIRGERKPLADVKPEQYHRMERVTGTFSRSFSLPNTVDGERVRADYRDGVLSVVLPMREEAKPRQIQVEVKG
jgi:HSP20 family protein